MTRKERWCPNVGRAACSLVLLLALCCLSFRAYAQPAHTERLLEPLAGPWGIAGQHALVELRQLSRLREAYRPSTNLTPETVDAMLGLLCPAHVFPPADQQPERKEIEASIKRLGSENFLERTEATRKLIRLGLAADPEQLVEVASRHADPEIRTRSRDVLAVWRRSIEEGPKLLEGMGYADQLHHLHRLPEADPNRARFIARGLDLLEPKGGKDVGDLVKLLKPVVTMTVASGTDAELKRIEGCIDEWPLAKIGWLLEASFANPEATHHERLVMQALRSERDHVMLAAVPHARPEMEGSYELLREIFDAKRYRKRLAGPLANTFKDAEAAAYLKRSK